ncbi:MAG: helix-turn-helix transcriptional regulator [Oscillospiraceae bacterium]|nr:helix-turn-helix transcriptional regulator [Oscillospiraceae bacterium]
MPSCNWYDLDVNNDRSQKVRYSCTDLPIGFFSGHHTAYANSNMPAHWHEDIELFVPREGDVIYNINGNLVRVSPGQGLLINSRRIHSSYTENMQECYYNVLIFHPVLLCVSKEMEQQLVQPIITSSFDYVILEAGTPWHENILHYFSMMREKHREKTSKSSMVGLIHLIWSEMAANIQPDDKPHSECSQLTAMKEMISYIDAHYSEAITLGDIAAAGYVSKRTCGNMFERFFYMPPMKYLCAYRIRKGVELLRDTDMTISEIAYACGFSGPSYFSEMFRRDLFTTPTDYRERLRRGDKNIR